MESNELTVVIVTYRSENKIFSCLNSIPGEINIIVVENSNNQEFKKLIESKYTNVKCILAKENLGYARGNNIGLNQVKTKYALVLNPDARLEKNCVSRFLDTAKKFQDFWLIGPANNQTDLSTNSEEYEVDNLKGFAIFFNIQKFNNTFFDENFFLYFEEIDLCKKVKMKKGKIILSKNIKINHDGARSVDKDNKDEFEKNRNWHWMWSTYYYHKKYKGFVIALIIIMPKFLSSIIKTFFYQLTFNIRKRDIYFSRMNGIFNSILGRKSWYRPSLD